MNKNTGTKKSNKPKTKDVKQYSKSKPQDKPKGKNKRKAKDDGTIRLNKYLAHSGVCSRREADVYIGAGIVKVNGKIILELGFKVTLEDKVQFEDQTLRYQ